MAERLTDPQLNRLAALMSPAIASDKQTLALIEEVRERRASMQRIITVVNRVLNESTRLSTSDADVLTAEIARRLMG